MSDTKLAPVLPDHAKAALREILDAVDAGECPSCGETNDLLTIRNGARRCDSCGFAITTDEICSIDRELRRKPQATMDVLAEWRRHQTQESTGSATAGVRTPKEEAAERRRRYGFGVRARPSGVADAACTAADQTRGSSGLNLANLDNPHWPFIEAYINSSSDQQGEASGVGQPDSVLSVDVSKEFGKISDLLDGYSVSINCVPMPGFEDDESWTVYVSWHPIRNREMVGTASAQAGTLSEAVMAVRKDIEQKRDDMP